MRKRINAKSLIHALFKGWKTRKIVNSLSQEIQEFVNTDDIFAKIRLKRSFYLLYDNVVSNKLWLNKNIYRL